MLPYRIRWANHLTLKLASFRKRKQNFRAKQFWNTSGLGLLRGSIQLSNSANQEAMKQVEKLNFIRNLCKKEEDKEVEVEKEFLERKRRLLGYKYDRETSSQ